MSSQLNYKKVKGNFPQTQYKPSERLKEAGMGFLPRIWRSQRRMHIGAKSSNMKNSKRGHLRTAPLERESRKTIQVPPQNGVRGGSRNGRSWSSRRRAAPWVTGHPAAPKPSPRWPSNRRRGQGGGPARGDSCRGGPSAPGGPRACVWRRSGGGWRRGRG